MKISIYISYILVIFSILISVYTKSIYDSDLNLRDDKEVKLYPIKRKSPNYEQPYYVIAHEEQPGVEYSDTLSNFEGLNSQRYRRIDEPSSSNLQTNNLQSIRDDKMKPAVLYNRQMLQNGFNRRTDRITKRDSESLPLQSDDSYGMVYRKGRLVGILERYPPVYELSPLSNVREGIEEIQPLPPNTRQMIDPWYPSNKLTSDKQLTNDWNWGKGGTLQDSIKYTDEKYPVPLTDYKTDSKISTSNPHKRYNTENFILTGREQEKNVQIKSGYNQMSKLGGGTESNEKGNSLLVNSPYRKEAQFQYDSSADLSDSKSSTDVKRSAPAITDEKISELKSVLDRIQNPESSDKVEEIEEDLREILNDMGLIDNEGKNSDSLTNKRNINSQEESDQKQVYNEDENLEQGVNKIEIVKTTRSSQKTNRDKREENKESQIISKNEKLGNTDGNRLESNEQKSENDIKNDSEKQNKEDTETVGENQESIERKRGASKINVANYQSEGAAYIRNKRQESSTASNDIMRGLEKSGELTVSGNKSPLASSDSGPDSGEKHLGTCSSTPPTSHFVNADLNQVKYQTDIERNLQAKIDAIKEEVKREIAALQSKNMVADKDTQESQRKKRDASTNLLDEETSAVNPQEHPEEKLIPHIRRKRNLQSIDELKRTKRGLVDFSNLQNIDSGDYLELNGDKRREDREMLTDYQMDPQENKYLPQNSEENNANNDNSKETRNTITQQEDLINAKAYNQKNLYQDSVARVNERSVDGSSISKSASDNEDAAKEAANIIKQHEESNESVADKNVESNVDSSFRSLSSEDNQLQQSDNDENLNSLEKQSRVPQKDVKKHQDTANLISSKNVIEPVANQHLKAQPKKLKADSQQEEIEKVQSGKELPKLDSVGKDNAEPLKNTKSDIQTLQARPLSGVLDKQDETSRITKEVSSDENKNSEVKQTSDEKYIPKNLRKRRQIEVINQNKPRIIFKRRKRADAVIPDGNVAYLPYRADEDDVDDEGDEFDDDGFDDRTSSMQKREVNLNNNQFRRSADYETVPEYELPDGYFMNNYQPEQKDSVAKRYVARINSDVYENPSPSYVGNYLYHPDAYVRRKRQDFDQSVSLHGGGSMLHHIAAIKERNEQHLDEFRNKRNFNRNQNSKDELQNIADLSDTDLFGALPQSYEGELSRFKRVKRVAKNANKQI